MLAKYQFVWLSSLHCGDPCNPPSREAKNCQSQGLGTQATRTGTESCISVMSNSGQTGPHKLKAIHMSLEVDSLWVTATAWQQLIPLFDHTGEVISSHLFSSLLVKDWFLWPGGAHNTPPSREGHRLELRDLGPRHQ